MFSIPAVQTSVAKRLTDSLREKNDVNLSIGRVSIGYFGNIKLNEIYVEDHHADTLLTAREIRSSIISFTNLINNSPNLGDTRIDGLNMHMRRYKNEDKDNLGILIEKLRKEPTGDSSHFELHAENVQILNSRYSYIDENLDKQDVVVVDNLSIFANELQIDDENIDIDIGSLKGYEHRGIEIDNLATQFHYDPNKMNLVNMTLQTPGSLVDADLYFTYELSDFSDFENLVQVEANFRESILSSNDLKAFYDGFGDDQLLKFQTKLTGTLNDFHLADFRLQGFDRTEIYGEFQVKGSFSDNPDDFSFDGSYSDFNTNYYDMVNFLPGALLGKLPENLRDFGSVNMKGNTYVTKTSLDADVYLSSQLGSANADFVLKNFNSSSRSNYKGKLVFKNFNLGKLINNPQFGKTSFNIDFDGGGFDREHLNTQLKGSISKLTFNNYTYSDIRVIGNLRNPLFNGYFVSNDPNLQMEFNGLADVSEDINVYDFEASVEYADLNELNFVNRDSISVFKGDVIMNMKGTNIDNAFGNILLLNTSYKNQNDLYYFDDLSIASSFEGPIRTITINSPDVINGEVTGIFKLNEVGALVENSIGSIYTNYKPRTITTNQYMEFDFDIYNQIVEVFYPEIELAPNTFIRGRVESDESEFRLTFKSPRIDIFDNMIEEINLQVDNTNPIYNTYFEADSVATDFYNFSEFSFINVTQRDTLFIRSEFKGGSKNNDEFNLNLFHTINENNKSVVGIQQSDFKFKENVWFLNEEDNRSNKIIFDNNFRDLQIDSLVMSHKNEQIRLSGEMRDSTYKNFKMKFENVDIGKITPDLDSLDLAGTLNGDLDLLQEDGAYFPNTNMKIDSLEVNDTYMGNLQMDVKGNTDLTNYSVYAVLQKEGLESLSAIGGINVSGNEPAIDLEVNLNKLNMSIFTALGADVLTDIRGFASGRAFVTGNYKNPDFSGSLDLTKAGLRIPYLNVDIDFQDRAKVNLTKQQFVFDNINIVDTKFNTRGVLDGTISHRNFSEWFLDLSLNSNRMLVLDTEADEDALYYGTAFIDGEASIKGPTDQLVIDVTAATERGTVFKIPLSDTESVGDNSFIRFLSPEEKAAKLAGEELELPEVKGIEMIFDLDITNDAEVEVVVDKTSGSTLRGRGSGNLLLEINTNGKFNMWGDFIVYEGVYNFKYAGLVQKVFTVESGGSINWDGDPTDAQLDVSAVYSLNANPAVLLENPSVNRKIPVDVVINLQGDIEQPDIGFEIDFPSASSTVKSELQYRIDDRATTELQALFLVTQGTFYSEFGLRGAAIYGTLAERASSIVNDIFADDDGKFQVGVNYVQGDRTPDQQTVDRFGLTLSTQISDRVIINGQVGVPIGGVTESVIIGDLEIEFLLNEDGTLRAKVFNRENNIQFIGEEIGFTQGVGLSYNVDFDTFKELIRKIANTELVDPNSEIERKESAKSMAPDYMNFTPADDN
ncbi:translocation/assembly module TamB domain-containing protein [Christiangramia sp. SM2212]|uniref:Translocation/assembly module TamB domain-containing protein n=1 Tax=Christiangramia sediminicola TaxID=3073267 RepID=A0ABU1EQR5_9FLAO|nr:translocation/assembly module TamB domain-containing protein [Christiangramia sp. SM2212]MDR5590319.1 translocation/assembly module TamB domain-containing protein [Christiangramia sp. SM2212]